MKTKIVVLTAVAFFVCLVGYMTLGALKSQFENQQIQQQEMIERNPDLAKFFKS